MEREKQPRTLVRVVVHGGDCTGAWLLGHGKRDVRDEIVERSLRWTEETLEYEARDSARRCWKGGD